MTREDFTTLIEGIGSGEKNTAAEMRNILFAFRDGIALSGDMKPIKCDAEYFAIHFDSTGLGRLEREGWAHCNGLNNTWDVRDRSLIGHGGDYTTPGFPFGSKDTVLPEHSHTFPHTLVGKGSGGAGDFASTSSNIAYSDNTTTNSAGVNAAGTNYPPSIAVVWIQKL
jgi:hypothetical protein